MVFITCSVICFYFSPPTTPLVIQFNSFTLWPGVILVSCIRYDWCTPVHSSSWIPICSEWYPTFTLASGVYAPSWRVALLHSSIRRIRLLFFCVLSLKINEGDIISIDIEWIKITWKSGGICQRQLSSNEKREILSQARVKPVVGDWRWIEFLENAF